MDAQRFALERSDEHIMQLVRQLQVAYKLKSTPRYGATRDLTVHCESVAEHIFALFFLNQYFLPLEDPLKRLDMLRVQNLILFHDFGEIPDGDLPYHLKTAESERREREAAKEVFAALPLSMRELASNSWHEYEAKQSPEALYVNALDKIEPAFELLHPVNERTVSGFPYELHIGKKLKATERFPVMRRFVQVISADMLQRGVLERRIENV